MPTHPLSCQPSAEQLNRLHDLAKERALQLRAQAIDDFWRRAVGRLRASLSMAGRPTRSQRGAIAG